MVDRQVELSAAQAELQEAAKCEAEAQMKLAAAEKDAEQLHQELTAALAAQEASTKTVCCHDHDFMNLRHQTSKDLARTLWPSAVLQDQYLLCTYDSLVSILTSQSQELNRREQLQASVMDGHRLAQCIRAAQERLEHLTRQQAIYQVRAPTATPEVQGAGLYVKCKLCWQRKF